jgi:hypothetical protein
MKLNFLNILNNKSNPDEIAEQIVALEEKQKQCQEEQERAKRESKEIRSRVMCGEKVNPEVIKSADSKFEETKINLEIICESIEKLKEKLNNTLLALRDEEVQRITEERKRLAVKREKDQLELWKAKGHILGMAIAFFGHPEKARRHLEEYPAFSPSPGDELHNVFHTEKEKALAEMKRPTVSDIENKIFEKDHWVKNFNLEEECIQIMEKHRAKTLNSSEPFENISV